MWFFSNRPQLLKSLYNYEGQLESMALFIVFTYQSSHSCAILFCKLSVPSGKDISKPIWHLYTFYSQIRLLYIYLLTFPNTKHNKLTYRGNLLTPLTPSISNSVPQRQPLRPLWMFKLFHYLNCATFSNFKDFGNST